MIRNVFTPIPIAPSRVETGSPPSSKGKESFWKEGHNTPEQFAAFLKADLGKWAKVVRDSGAKID